PSITRRLIGDFARRRRHQRPSPQATANLTPRELDVLRLMARGMSNAEIAAELVLAEQTVKTHVGHVLTKLSLRDRTQAVVFAYESGRVGGSARPAPDWAVAPERAGRAGRQRDGSRTSLPVVRRARRSSWTRRTSLSPYSPPLITRSRPSATRPNSSSRAVRMTSPGSWKTCASHMPEIVVEC